LSTSQASLEMMALISLAILFLGLVQVVYVRERNANFKEGLFLEEKQVADTVAGEVNQAYLSGDGYSVNLTLPKKIGAYSYNVSTTNGHVYVRLNGYSLSVASKMLPAAVAGTFRSGTNRLSNTGGAISVA
jgi:hypothetical protein